MKKLLVVTVVLALLVSCGDGGGGGFTAAQTKTFWAQNITNDTFYQLEAELLAQNSRCEIWVEKGSGVTADQAQSVASKYSNEIYPKMINAFSITNFSFSGYTFSNIMDFADAVADGDGKLSILLLNIKDGFNGTPTGSFLAGYYWAYDILSTNPPAGYKTNKRDMLYIDTYPLKVGSEMFYRTIAHEMQHLMNFTTSLLKRVNDNKIYAMDTWIDEGLSSAAESIYLGVGQPLVDRISDFNNGKLIAKGNNFFVWANRENEDPNAVLDDYATVYLFFQWLRLQTGGTTIYKNIIASNNYDYRAITANTTAINSNWSDLLGTWLRANYDRSSSGFYGYKNDTTLNNSIKRHYAPGGSSTINLYPGEGVYSNASSSTIPTSVGNIKYVGLGTVSGSTITSGALLTYNTSTTVTYNDNGVSITPPDSGTITGNAPPPNANIVASGSRSVLGGVSPGPFPISAGDMLRRRGYGYERNFPGVNSLILIEEAAGE